MSFVAEKDEDAYLCQCKHTANAPFCDGTHKQFTSEQVGQEGPGIQAGHNEIPIAVATQEEPTVEFIHNWQEKGCQS